MIFSTVVAFVGLGLGLGLGFFGLFVLTGALVLGRFVGGRVRNLVLCDGGSDSGVTVGVVVEMNAIEGLPVVVSS